MKRTALSAPFRAIFFSSPLLLVLSLVTTEVAAAPPVEVNTCGQLFIKSSGVTRVVLGSDLDCTGLGLAIDFNHAASVNLAGFTITGGETAIHSSRRCKVFSDPPGGTITGQTSYAIECGTSGSRRSGRATIRDVTISDASGPALDCAVYGRKGVRLTGVTIRNWGGGIVGQSIKIADSLIDNNAGIGVRGSPIRVKNSAITNNGSHGLDGGAENGVRLKNSVVSGNGGDGIHYTGVSGPVKIQDSDIVGNGGVGVIGGNTRMINSTVTGNALSGVLAFRVNLQDSTATGNGTSPECGVTIGCGDLATGDAPPRLRGASVCGTSYDRLSGIPGESWGVCALD